MMEYGNTSVASIPILLSECVEVIESRWMEVKKFFWQDSVEVWHGDTSCYNLVKHGEHIL